MFIVVGVWISPMVVAAVAAVLVFRAGWWVLPAVAACAVLAGVAVLRLARWRDRKDAALWAAQRPVQLRTEPARELPRTERPAIEVHYHYHAAPEAPARVIRGEVEGG